MTRILTGLLVLAFLVALSAAADSRLDELLPASLAPLVSARAAGLFEASDQEVAAAVKQVVEHSNDEQVQAIATKNPALMADTVTTSHYQELVQINQDLLDSGVSSIQLVRLDWGAVAVSGSSATVTTYETWTTVFDDGSTEQSRDRNDYTLVLEGGAWKIARDDHPGQTPPAGITPPSTRPVPGVPAVPDSQNASHNWSGYAATGGGTYSAVSGTWTVPQFNGTETAFGIDAAWVGIGGVRNNDLIQAGTEETVNGSGRSQYEAWVEMLPAASRPVPLQVHPGDSISVAITEQSTNTWLIEFTNNTTTQTYHEVQRYRSSHSSAEWVEEAPSGGRGGVLPLANFGKIDFTSATAVKNGETLTIAALGAQAITMIGSNNQALAVPSPLGEDGSSFSVSRTDAPATAASRGRGSFQPAPPDSGN